MANVQAENGYTRIANELLEALVKVRLPPSEKDIVLFIIRKTYGFGKKQDRISLTQFEVGTGLSRMTVVKSLKNLLLRKIVVKTGILLKVNKDYETWVVNAGLLVKSRHEFGKPGYTKTSKRGYTHKRKKKTKENTTSNEVSKDMNYYDEETGEYGDYKDRPKKPRNPKNTEIIKLAFMFDKMASEYTHTQIMTPKSYFIIENAITKHKLTYAGVAKIFEEWFEDRKVKTEDKVKLSFALSANNINQFKVLH